MRKIFKLATLQLQTFVMFALFLLLIYMPYQHADINLFPFEINAIYWRSAWYYIVLFLLLYLFVCVRMFLLDSIRKIILLRDVVLADISLFILFVPLFFVSSMRFFALLVLFLALSLIIIDVYHYKSFRNMRFLFLVGGLFLFTNIILIFVNWQNNQKRFLIANDIVNYCHSHEDWNYDVPEWTIAKYVDSELIASKGDFDYPIFFDFDVDRDGLNYITMRAQSEHYIFQYDGAIYIVSRESWVSWFRYLVNFTYLFTLFLILTFLFFYFKYIFRYKHSPKSFFVRLQSTLIFFLLGCMLLVFVVASVLIINRHRSTACKNEEQRMEFLKKSLEGIVAKGSITCDSLFFAEVLNIANILESDISVYSKVGLKFFTTNPHAHCNEYFDWYSSPFYNMGSSVYANIVDDKQLIESYAVVINCEGEPVYLLMTSSLEIRKLERNITLFFVLVFNLYFIVILISFLLSYFISRRLAAPLSVIENNMRNLVVGGDNAKIDYPTSDTDALSKLIAQYNSLIDKLEVSVEELAQTEREKSWRQMARQMAHEIKNPLTPMQLLTQRLLIQNSDDFGEYKESVHSLAKALLQGIDSITTTTEALSNFAKTPISSLEPINIVESVRYTVDLFRNNEEHISIEFSSSLDKAMVLVDKEMIGHVFNNLLKNAIQAIPNDREGKISVNIYHNIADVIVSVKDNGVGIPSENEDKLFNVNFTTKTKGMGLGLLIVKNVVDQAKGSIRFSSIENKGTTFIVSFPLQK